MPSKKNKTSLSTSGQMSSIVENNQPTNRFDILGEMDDVISDDSSIVYNTQSTDRTIENFSDVHKNGKNDSNNNNDGFQSVNYNRGKSRKDDKKNHDKYSNNIKSDNPVKPINKSVKMSDDNYSKNPRSIEINKKNNTKPVKSVNKLIGKNENVFNGKSENKVCDKINNSDNIIDHEDVHISDQENDHVNSCAFSENIDDVTKPSDNENNNDTFMAQESNDVVKKGIYVPPSVSENNWIVSGNQRRKREKINIGEGDNKDTLSLYDPDAKLPGDDMKLNTTWVVWIHENDNQDWSLKSYKSIYEIDSVGSMWRFLHVLDNLDKNIRQYYIMRNGITPIWEDNNNKQGAICSIMIDNMNKFSSHTKGDLGVDAFSAICILVLNESFVRNSNVINGLCYSIKSRSVLIKLWIKDFESNKNFREMLPITILKHIDTILSNMDNKNHSVRNNVKSGISVQLKAIKPNY